VKKPEPAPSGDLPDGLKLLAIEVAATRVVEQRDQLRAALGWALAHAHPMSTPEWRAEAMVRAGWIPSMKTPEQFNN